MNSLLQDLRFGLRMLVKKPIFALIAVVTLALGIGANTAIFSVVDAVLLRPLPYPEANRLVFLWSGESGAGSAWPDYEGWRDRNQSFDGLAAFYNGDFNLSSAGSPPEFIQGAYITANLFQVLKISPSLGRLFSSEEEQYGKHHVVLLSDGLWQRRFAGDRGIVGRDIKLGGETYRVVGVMPPGLPFFDNLPEVELWTPISFAPKDNQATRNNYFITLVGRLKPGVTVEQAQQDTIAVAKNMYEEIRGIFQGSALVVPVQEQIAGDSRTGLLVLLGAVAFVLLVACVNVANLLLARASARERELAIRASLGASRARIVRQVMIEGLPLGIIGGLLGLVLAIWGIDVLSSLLPSSLPRGNPITVNSRVLLFTFALALLTIVIFGLLPALQAAKADVRESLNEGGRSGIGGRRQGRMRRLLVITEVALALVLLVASGLMVRSFIKLRQVDVGFTENNVITMRVPLPEATYPEPNTADDPREPAGLAFYEQLLERVKTLPGVKSATAATLLPLGAGQGWGKLLTIEGQEADSMGKVPVVRFALVSPDYFQTLGIAVQQGRPFTTDDKGNSQPVAIINETLARRFFANENPIGKTLWMGPPENLMPRDLLSAVGRFQRRQIVGVVSDVKGGSLNQPTAALVYSPLTQYRREGWSNNLMLAVQTNVRPDTLAPAIREQVRGLDPDQPVTGVSTMDELLDRTLSQAKFALLLFGLFAVLALVLAAIGIYGVMSTAVTQRTHEIGLRMALGAQKRDVLRLVVGEGMILVVIGIAAGLASAVVLTRLMATLLFGVSTTDPTTLLVIPLLLASVAMLACYLPARRATRVDPLVALRYE
ncbi:MAG TPA: ABC transporter permease [Pyrinomonadaceae bacterium]|nr:ABC transporter permease [Pyrinomonadaceae bacterium]